MTPERRLVEPLGFPGTVGRVTGRIRKPAGALLALTSLTALAILAPAGNSAPAATAVGDGRGALNLKTIGRFDAPVQVTTAPGRRNRKLLFVVEQEGFVRVVRGSRTLNRPFLDIRDQVLEEGERGLLSIAFDPRYAKNRRFYAYFTDHRGDINVTQYRRRKDSKTRAKSRPRGVIEVQHRGAPNHNGGTVAFGPDGHMYLGTGDGGGGCDSFGNGQNRGSLLGKLLRIDPKPAGGYTVPADNPFLGSATRDEIYSLGLRNPFRFSFDRATKTIAIGDVGQSTWEEVDYESLQTARGANFGWNTFEGTEPAGCGGDPSSPTPAEHSGPIHQYGHSGPGYTGCSITGGVVVRDRGLPTLYGRYVFADYCAGELRSLVPGLEGAAGERGTGLDLGNPTSFAKGRRGRLYATSRSGQLYRIKAAAAATSGAGNNKRAGDGRGGFKADPIASFDSPVYVHGPEGAGGLVFVVEQRGVIRMIKDGKKLGGKFLDIHRRVQSGGERGLLSVAFSPAYRKNRRFYVFYTDGGGDLRVEEYKRSRNNARDAKEGSARKVIEIDHSANSNHNGGQLQFGPDRKLYISTGDGGSGGDPPENAQNKSSLLGKILRIDPRKSKRNRYTVPNDNPFTGRPGRREIFSFGLRNPYRFSFDRGRRRIAIGDVGQDAREEIDFEKLRKANGANFGWDAFEGTKRFNSPDASPPPKNHEKPIHDYSHAGGNCSITGGYVVRDRRINSLFGRYVYTDFCRGEIRSLIPTVRGGRKDRSAGLGRQSGISSFGEDARGRIYVANLSTGKVSRINPR